MNICPLTSMGPLVAVGLTSRHIITSGASIAHLMHLSIFILFVDLTKAFDRIIRQLVMGWSGHEASRKMHTLEQLGVSNESAKWLVEYIDLHGCVFEQWNLDDTTRNLARTLHDGAWFQVRGGTKCITSETGGRQGCCLGAIVFNSGYTVALDILHWRLKKHGVILRLKTPQGVFWSKPGDETAERTDIVDATFVDDECIVLLAHSPKRLSLAIDITMETLITVFRLCHLQINFMPGKLRRV